MRLVDGETELEGRVEVCLEGLWGNICDERWRAQENGLVVCRQVGINATGQREYPLLYFRYKAIG